MKVYNNINTYFLNGVEKANDYSNSFYIRKIAKNMKFVEPAEEFWEAHKRGFFEVAILQRSTINIQIGNQTLQEMKNSLAIVSPFQVINYSVAPPNDDYGYIIYFNASIFTSLNQSYGLQNEFPFFKIHTMPLYRLPKKDFKDILSIAEELYMESRSTALHSFEVVRSLLLILLYKIKRSTQDNKGMVTANRSEAIMSTFEQLILSGNNYFLSVNEYASKMNIDYKMLYAKTLLHQIDKPIAEVAYELNFNEVANFNQFFKRNMGITATQFRSKQK